MKRNYGKWALYGVLLSGAMFVISRAMTFMGTQAGDSWRYAGQNVAFGDPAAPIFWYQPQGSPTWRVIYADLHVADVTAENLPK